MENEKPTIGKAILNNKRALGGITISDLKLYYRAIEIKKKLHGIGTEMDRLINIIKSKTQTLTHTPYDT